MMMYFKLEELLYSSTAFYGKINNLPSFEIVANLKEFAIFLSTIREEYGHPIFVTSGYRGDELNRLIGGAKDSGHLYGYCADLIVKDRPINEFYEWLSEYLCKNGYKFDELILESKNGDTMWVHFAWKGKDNIQRMKTDIILDV